jgi:hypothetical protein
MNKTSKDHNYKLSLFYDIISSVINCFIQDFYNTITVVVRKIGADLMKFPVHYNSFKSHDI